MAGTSHRRRPLYIGDKAAANYLGRRPDGGLGRLVGLLPHRCGLATAWVCAANFPPISTRCPLPPHSVHSIPAISPVPPQLSHGIGTFSFIDLLAAPMDGCRPGPQSSTVAKLHNSTTERHPTPPKEEPPAALWKVARGSSAGWVRGWGAGGTPPGYDVNALAATPVPRSDSHSAGRWRDLRRRGGRCAALLINRPIKWNGYAYAGRTASLAQSLFCAGGFDEMGFDESTCPIGQRGVCFGNHPRYGFRHVTSPPFT